MTRVDDEQLSGQRRPGPVDGLGVTHRVRAAADDGPAELGQRLEGGRAAGAVGDHADVALEVAQRLLGLDPEQAVHPAAVEPHVQQPLLQRCHVVTGHQPGRHEEQDPVTEAPTGLLEGVVGARPDLAVDRDPALLLEGPHGPVGGFVEQRTCRVQQLGTLALGEQPEHGELGPDLGDGRPGVAAGIGAPLRAR
jgi:hypothetical protein